MRTRQPVLIEHITDFSGLGAEPGTYSIICVPLSQPCCTTAPW